MRLFAIAAVAVSLGLAGCQSKKKERADEPPPATNKAPSNNAAAIERLAAAIERQYSHRDRLGIDWKAELEKHRAALEAAGTPAEFAFAAVKVLAAARDIHLTVSAGPASKPIPTYKAELAFNMSIDRTFPKIADLEHLDDCIAVGHIGDVGYLMLKSFVRGKCPRFPSTLLAAWKKISGSRAMIVDVRANTGGDELLARQVAARFVTADVTYAAHENGPPPPSGAAKRHERRLMAAMPRQRFTGKVALLIGPANLSSAEAFILMMMQAPQVTTIGDKTYGSSGNPKPIDLGNGVIVALPSWRAFTTGGKPIEGVGIAPAIHVAWGDEGDPIIDAALKALAR